MDSRSDEATRPMRGEGDSDDKLLQRVYDELRQLAGSRMRQERGHHTLQATALVHEVWLRLGGQENVSLQDRGHFLSAASEAMRRVLIDHARMSRAQKRGGAADRVTLGAVDAQVELEPERVLAMDEALEQLAKEDERAAAVARLRFLTGLSVEETAEVLGTSVRTVHREWSFARARLSQFLDGSTDVR